MFVNDNSSKRAAISETLVSIASQPLWKKRFERKRIMTKKSILNTFLQYVLLALLVFPFYSFGEFKNLKTQIKKITLSDSLVAYKKVLSHNIINIESSNQFITFNSRRNIWIKYPEKELVNLNTLVPIPEDIDWFESLIIKNNFLLISACSFPEERKKKEDNSPLGAYRIGATPIGLLIVDLSKRECEIIGHFKVDQSNIKEIQKDYPEELFQFPKTIKPIIQSHILNNNKLIIGSYGELLELDIENKIAKILDLDLELQLSRRVVFKMNEIIWVYEDEGGSAGGWLSKIKDNNKISYRILGHSNAKVDAIINYKNKLLASSSEGVVQIDEPNNFLIHYQFTNNIIKPGVYKIKEIDDKVYGEREDGWILFNFESNSGIHFKLKGKSVSNNIYSIGKFKGKWYIGNKKELIEITF